MIAVFRVDTIAFLRAGGAKSSTWASLVTKSAAPTRRAETGAADGVTVRAVAAVASEQMIDEVFGKYPQ